jgi:V8-like Glu-specific endopeptidase
MAALAPGCGNPDPDGDGTTEIGSARQNMFGSGVTENTSSKDAPAGPVVYLSQILHSGGEKIFCSGTAIGPKAVLTAGHCLKGIPAADLVVHLPAAQMGGFSAHAIEPLMIHPLDTNDQPTVDLGVFMLEAPIPAAVVPKYVPLFLGPVKAAWDAGEIEPRSASS